MFFSFLAGKLADRNDARQRISDLTYELKKYQDKEKEYSNKPTYDKLFDDYNKLQTKYNSLSLQYSNLSSLHNHLIEVCDHDKSNFKNEQRKLNDIITDLKNQNSELLQRKNCDQEKVEFEREKADLELQIINFEDEKNTLREENYKYKDKNDKLIDQITNLQSKIKEIMHQNANLQSQHEEIMYARKFVDTASSFQQATLQGVRKFSPGIYSLSNYYSSIRNFRLLNAFNTPLSIISYNNISADIRSADATYYGVTLTECTCEDFRRRHMPCKHMIFLAYSFGLLDLNIEKNRKEYEYSIVNLNNCLGEIKNLKEEKKKEQEKIKKAKQQITKLAKEQKAAEKIRQEYLQEITSIVEAKCNGYPQLASIMAELQTLYYEKIAASLLTKPIKARKASIEIKELRKTYRSSLAEKKILEYKLAYIESMFPNINDIFDSGFTEEQEHFVLETRENTDPVRFFVSDEDYHALSVSEKNQLALDRYVEGRKSKWQIGRDYEMYIGYHCARLGYHVTYTGIIQKLEDMGRDLIAMNGNKIYIIQCKRWSKEKTIHEKHIFQLFGTVVLYNIDHPKHPATGVFVSTTQLSPKAQKIAEELNIQIMLVNSGDFPRIKCNINRSTGEKIYHLPFDQQYDSVVIDESDGECYAFTVKQAEEKGFRRALKHFVS